MDPPRIDQDMSRVAVDADESDERNGDAGLFGDFTDNGFADGFADLDPASRQLPVAIVDPTDQQELTGAVADRRECGQQNVVRSWCVRVAVVFTYPDHAPDSPVANRPATSGWPAARWP